MSNVVVIGARSRRQGIGEYVTRWFAQAGARVSAIVGTSTETIEEARRRLRDRWKVDCVGYVSLERALRVERPDIVAICSPYPLHREHIEAAANAGAHCLCEKPLWWDPALDPVDETRRLADGFDRANRLLATVTQWPYTLPYFFQLCPEIEGQRIRSFEMTLSPISGGEAMVPDAVPHGLSMLEGLVGAGEVSEPRAFFSDGSLRDLQIEFRYKSQRSGTLDVRFVYRTQERPPREASYAINGCRVRRRIAMPSYEIEFERAETEEGTQRLALDDPLRLLVEDFLARCDGGETTDTSLLASRAKALREIWSVAAQESGAFSSSEASARIHHNR